MKRAIVVLLAISMVGCASIPPQEYYGAEDPFSSQLDHYYVEREKGKRTFLWSVVGVASTLVLASVARTASSMGAVSPTAGTVAEMTGYAAVAAGSITGYLGFRRWEQGSSDYLETLRLQSQYYNLVQ